MLSDSDVLATIAVKDLKTAGKFYDPRQGKLRAASSAEAERRHLALVSNQKDLEVFADDFDRIVLLFSITPPTRLPGPDR